MFVMVRPKPTILVESNLTALPAGALRFSLRPSAKELEERHLGLERHADPFVGHLEYQHLAVERILQQLDCDPLPVRRVFHRVHQEVEHNLLQSLLVRPHLLRHTLAMHQRQHDVFFGGVHGDEVEDVGEQLVDAEIGDGELELVDLDAPIVLAGARRRVRDSC